MRTTLQHTYAADIHGLAARLSAKIIAGLPILCYLAMTAMSAQLSFKYIWDDLCHYVPGAYWDKNYTRQDSIVNIWFVWRKTDVCMESCSIWVYSSMRLLMISYFCSKDAYNNGLNTPTRVQCVVALYISGNLWLNQNAEKKKTISRHV